jgi:hypothetical protein
MEFVIFFLSLCNSLAKYLSLDIKIVLRFTIKFHI